MTIFTNLSSRFLRFKSFCRLVFSFLFRIPLLPFIWLGRWLWWCGIQLRRDPGLVFIVLGLLAVFFFSHLPRFAYAVPAHSLQSSADWRSHRSEERRVGKVGEAAETRYHSRHIRYTI